MPDLNVSDLKALTEAADNSGLARLVGFELAEAGEGYAKAHLTVTREHTNLFGMTHGAILYALADHTGSVAGNSLSRRAVISQSTAYFLGNPAIGTRLTAEARVTQAGRRLGMTEVEVTDSQGKLLLSFNAGMYFLDKEPSL